MTRVLLVRLSAMGDIVQSLGAVRALARERPELELHFLAQDSFLPLFEGLDFLASAIPHKRRPALRGILSTAVRLRRMRPDVALDLQGNWKSAALARLSGARRRIGVAGPWRREPGSQVLLNEKISCEDSHHPAHLALEVVRALAPRAEPLEPRLVASPAEMERECAALAALGFPSGQPLRVLVMGHQRDPRAWPAGAMAREVREHRGPSLWLAGPDEAGLPVPEGVVVLRHGPGELRRLVALGCYLARVGGEAVGPDRGAIHVLAACGTRSTVLFGPQDPSRTAPPTARVLVHPNPPDCAPCRQRRCTHSQGPVCMEFTSAEGREPS